MIKMNMETAGAVWVIVLATLVKSEYPMAPARLLFFVRFRYWLISGGTMTRRAWGKVMFLKVPIADKPTARDASVCPRPTDCTPARTISAMKAAVYVTSQIRSANMPPGTVNPPDIRPKVPCGSGCVTTKGAPSPAILKATHATAPNTTATAHPAARG